MAVVAGKTEGFGFERVELEGPTDLPDLCVDLQRDLKGAADQGDRHLECVCA